MRHKLPLVDWMTALVEAVQESEDGDTIICSNVNVRELAERARKRMCPSKTLVYEVEEDVF